MSTQTRILLGLTVIVFVIFAAQATKAPALQQPIKINVDIRMEGRPPGVTIYGLNRVPMGTHRLKLLMDNVNITIWEVTLSAVDVGSTIFGNMKVSERGNLEIAMDTPLFRVVALDDKDLVVEIYDEQLAKVWGKPINQ